MTDALIRLIEFEAESEEIRYFQTLFMPGPLQTADYARATLEIYDDEDMPETTRRARAESRQRRGETILARIGKVKIRALLDESVFWRPVGGPAVLAGQLRVLRDLAAAGRIGLRMIPFDSDAAVTNNPAFDLLTLRAGDHSSDVLYRETGLGDEIVEGGASTGRHRARYGKIWQAATTEEETIDFLRRRIDELEEPRPSAPREGTPPH